MDKKIRDSFKLWDADDTDVRTAGDPPNALRGQILKDFEQCRAGKEPRTMGARYYRKLRLLFAGENIAHLKFVVRDAELVIDPEIVKAMAAAKRQRPDRSKLSL